MRRAKDAKASQQKPIESDSSSNAPVSKPSWESVVLEAEEQMAELRRSIEWAKEARARLRTSLEDPYTIN